MPAPIIAVRGLTKNYDGNSVVTDLSFDVQAGMVTAFLGPNGAGKTTSIRVILGLAHPTSGEATVFGEPFTKLARPITQVGVLIDGSGFHPLRSARSHLRMLAAAGGIGSARVNEVLDVVELTDAADRKVGGFSLGMRQRLGLAAALLGDPTLLILDEPANGLDPAGIRWLRSFLEGFAADGGTVFVSSHVLSEVALFAEEVIVIHRGRLIRQTSVDQLTAGATVTVCSPDWQRLHRRFLDSGASVTAQADNTLHVAGLSIEDVGQLAAQENAVLHQLTSHTRTLEDVFLELTSTRENDHATAH